MTVPSPPEHQVIIGTAGHVDHGKTTLVRAMTGIDADRWEEEKRRGITIDIGFAHLARERMALSFIDVPGHRDFVTNMLAGVHSVDVGMLVVAADESVMPQTREHLWILSLLGLRTVVPVITKIDLADDETLELVELEIRELFDSCGLPEPDRFFPVSATTGVGVAELTDHLFQLGESIRRDDSGRPPWFAVDRSFTMKGHGTVLTGTLMAGTLSVGDRIYLYPMNRSAVIKQLNNHGQAISSVSARKRVAVNVPQLDRQEVSRGKVAVGEPLPLGSRFADAMIRIPFGSGEMEDLTRVRISIGSDDVLARIKWLEAPCLSRPGEAWCQLRFERPCACFSGQRFIVRAYSPVHTIGGGEILDPQPPKRRGYRPVSDHLARKRDPSFRERLLGMVREAGVASAEALRTRLFLTKGRFDSAVRELAATGEIAVLGREPNLYAAETLAVLIQRAQSQVAAFHREFPRKKGMPAGRLHGIPDDVRTHMLDTGLLIRTRDGLALPDFQPSYSPTDEALFQKLILRIGEGGLTPPLVTALVKEAGDEALVRELLTRGCNEGKLVRVSADLYLGAAVMQAFLQSFDQWANAQSTFGIQEVKAAFPLARKYLVPLLEYLDGARITVKIGDQRRYLGLPNTADTLPGHPPGPGSTGAAGR